LIIYWTVAIPSIVADIADGLRAMALNPLPEVRFSEDPDEQGHLEDLALELIAVEGRKVHGNS
jgi:hypothetical protein